MDLSSLFKSLFKQNFSEIPTVSSVHNFKLEDLLNQNIPEDAAAEIMLAPNQQEAAYRYMNIMRRL